MIFSKNDSINLVLNRFKADDFIQAMQIFKLGQTLGFSQLDDDDLYFLIAVLHDLKFGTDLCLADIEIL